VIIEQKLQAVDPIELAQMSGITHVPRFSAPLPPVVRPFLLTSQLRGCGCADCGDTMGVSPDYGRLRQYVGEGLGFLDTLVPPDPNTFDINALQVPAQVQGTGTPGNISMLQTMAVGANFVPGVGQIASVAITTFGNYLKQFESWFGIRAGAREADVIVPVQNNIVNSGLGPITNQILSGMNPSLDTLYQLYRQVWSYGVAFQEFVLMRQFTDRRASGQALNTVMPYIDGSCGYPVPVAFTATPGQFNCLSWGDGTVGGVGQNGMLGAIGRAIMNLGGTVPALPDLHQAANSGIKPASVLPGYGGGLPATILGVSTPLAFGLGLLVLFAYKKGLF
jgi:hypothetical protein